MSDFAPIVSPQAPADMYALPYAKRPVAKALPLTSAQRQSASEAGLKTLADVDLWLARGGDWTELKGVGAKTAEKIQAAYESMQITKSWEIARGD